MKHLTKVVENPIETSEATKFLTNPSHGAQSIFIGNVRNLNLGKTVISVSYDAFAALAENVFLQICEEATQKWGSDLQCAVIHRTGSLAIGEASLVVAVGSRHRNESYLASRYILEEIKTRAPIWKKEYYTNGETDWVRGHALCNHREVSP